jgi:lysine 2,3-aminomutase
MKSYVSNRKKPEDSKTSNNTDDPPPQASQYGEAGSEEDFGGTDDEKPGGQRGLRCTATAHGPAVRVPLAPQKEALRPFRPPYPADFIRRFFPQATAAEWNDWRWQLRNRVTRLSVLSRFIRLSDDEERVSMSGKILPFSITPYYLTLIDPDDPSQPLRKTVVPTVSELFRSEYESDDPLDEDRDSPVPGLVHRYPDRVLLIATNYCSVYCRYCTRARMVGGSMEARTARGWWRAVDYIEEHPEVRDVLISGGDPLIFEDGVLEPLLARLRRIPHVEILRIGTKVPAVLPQRITPSLVRMLKKYHPLFMSIHFTHPDELRPEVEKACAILANAGIPLGSQTVLLRGINDDTETLKTLFQGLLRMRVKPYYLYQCDPVTGSTHFRTSVSKGMELIESIRGHTSGYAVPTYVIDAPGGGGKIPIYPETVLGRSMGRLLLQNYEGKSYGYPDVQPMEAKLPAGEGGACFCVPEGRAYS